MVQGLGFLSKKSWHTKNKANQEKVWIAEEQKKAEEAKTKELARQIQQEREEEEFAKISGKKTTIKDRGIDWMYQGATTGELAKQDAEKKQEEYLLGKEFVADGAVKGDFDDGQQQPDGIHNVVSKAAAAPAAKPTETKTDYYGPASDKNIGAHASSSSHLEPSVASRNEEFRMRMEDPMFVVSQKQREKELKHEKAKALYEKVVGPSGRGDDDDDEGDGSGDHSSFSGSSNDKRREHRRSKKSKKERKRHKKHKKDRKKSSKRHRRHHHRYSSSDDDDSRGRDRDYETKRRRRKRSLSRSRSRSRSRSSSRSPDSERHLHHHKKSRINDEYDDNDYNNRHQRHHHRRLREDEYRSRDNHRDHHRDGDRGRDRYDRDYEYSRHEYDDSHSRRQHHHHNEQRQNRCGQLKDPPFNSQPGNDGPKKIEGYGLKGASSNYRPSETKDLGPSRELLQKKREEQENERRRIREIASSRRRTSQEDRKRALEEMQDDARKRDSRLDRQARHQKDSEEDEQDEFGRSTRRGTASFLDDIHKQSHGISGEGSLSSRVAQNRHTQQRLHESFF